MTEQHRNSTETTGGVPNPAIHGHPQALALAAVIAVAVALGSVVIAAFTLRHHDEATAAELVSPTSNAPLTTPMTMATSTTALDAESALKALAGSHSSRFVTQISEDECGDQYAMLEVDDEARLVRWSGNSWDDETALLDIAEASAESPIDELRAADVTMDGTYEFLIRFAASETVMHSYGGIFGPHGCEWRWIPIFDWGDEYRFIDAIGIDEFGALTAEGFVESAGRKSVYLDYDSVSDMFTTYSDEQTYTPSAPPPVQAPKPYVVSTYCEVKPLLQSNMQGTMWSVTIYNQWSDGSRTIASSSSYWSWDQPSC